jgi:hypothetical protein
MDNGLVVNFGVKLHNFVKKIEKSLKLNYQDK